MSCDIDWDAVPPLRDVIARHELKATKKLGQNFLLDTNITDKIVTDAGRSVGDFTDMTVFEIGPGPGGLTRSLLKSKAQQVIAIEFDPRAVRALQELKDIAPQRLQIIHGDALEADLAALAPQGRRAIVANLPYNIATPLLVSWLRHIRNQPGFCDMMALMFQREVADRICAAPGTGAYGRLAVLAQWLCETKTLYRLPPRAFTPPPKVHSAVVQFIPRAPAKDAPAFEDLEKVTATAFQQRRKMARSALKPYEDRFARAGIDPAARPETLSIAQYLELARKI